MGEAAEHGWGYTVVCEMHDGRAYDEGSHGAEGEGILPMGLGDDEGCEQGDIDGQVLPSVPLFGVFGVVVGLGLLGVGGVSRRERQGDQGNR